MKSIKTITLATLFGSIILLTGCTSMMNSLGYHKATAPIVRECQSAPLLISNLTEPPATRYYLLPDGRLCYFNVPAPKKTTFKQWINNSWSNIKAYFGY